MSRYLTILILLIIPFKCLCQTNTEGVITIGRNALYYEDYALSIQYFNQAIQAKPYLYEPYFFRAISKYYLGDYIGSIEDCNASIERDPFIDDTYKLRAIDYIMTEQFALALADYRKLLSMEVENKDIWSNMVLCETQMDSLDNADKMLDTMIQKWPTFARCYILKAQIAVQNKDTLKADSLLDKALEISPYEVDAWAAKGQLLLQRNMFQQSEQAYEKAILQKPKEAGFYINRALSKYHQSNLRGAMEDYDISLDLDPENYLAHYNRGLLRMQVGENNAAIVDFDYVLKKEPNDRLALFNRATLSELTGNYNTAIKDYTTVLEQYPNFITGYQNRAKCYRAIGESKKALADERRVVSAELDERFGTKKPKNEKVTRKQKEQNIDDYKKLVVENDEENLAKFYSSDYRGKIQNKKVAIEYQPLFIYTFTKIDNGLSEQYNYAAFVEHINVKKELTNTLFLSTHEETITPEQYKTLQQKEALLTEQIEKQPKNGTLYFYKAIYQFVQKNYLEALASLDKALKYDAEQEGALFLHAVLQTKQAEINKNTAPIGNKDNNMPMPDEYKMYILSAIKDMDRAIQMDDTCPYLYYNRGCLYAKIKDNEHALADFNSAIQLNSHLGEAYYNRGLLNIELKNNQQGFEDLSKAGENGLYSAYSMIKHFRKNPNK